MQKTFTTLYSWMKYQSDSRAFHVLAKAGTTQDRNEQGACQGNMLKLAKD
jgi:hypothetical protein